MKTKLLLPLLIGLSVASANAAITVLSSATGLNNLYQTTSISFSFTGLDLTGGDKLVVSIGAQTTNSGAGRDWSSVTFSGQSMTQAARVGGSTGSVYQSGIYYLDALTGLSSSGLLTISATTLNVRGATATAWVLKGTDTGHGASGATVGLTTSLTTTVEDSWVLAHVTVSGITVPVAQSPLTAGLTAVNPYNGSAQTSIGTGYQTVASSGTSLTPTFDIGATTVAAEFLAIPEPAAALLGGLGLLTLLRRRR